MTKMDHHKNIVIVGGGIIGCTTAYFLSQHKAFDKRTHSITVIEAKRIAAGASGKAGGLLATWSYPPVLAHLSFRLHEELAAKHGGESDWGYRRVSCAQVRMHHEDIVGLPGGRKMEELGKRKAAPHALRQPVPADLDWVDPLSIEQYEELSDQSSSAQVHPYHFTNAMAKLAQSRGVRFLTGSVEEILKEEKGSQTRVTGVRIRKPDTAELETMPADVVVVAAGPWTPKLLPGINITSRRAYKITFRTKKQLSPHCLFARVSYRNEGHSGRGSPNSVSNIEMYSRPGNELYVCSSGGPDPKLGEPSANDNAEGDMFCQQILEIAASISEAAKEGEITSRRVCFLPMADSGYSDDPIIGMTSVKGLIVAAGHGTWGIQNAPATGLLVSEIIFDGSARSASIAMLSPR